MATNKLLWSSKIIGVFFMMLVCTLSANAQFLRTSYFMEGTHYRQQLNPALTPTKGYFNLPVIGAVNATVGSTSLGYQDIIDIIDDGDDFYTKPDFMNRLKDNNKLNVNFSTEILSAGWYKGKNFWSFNIGLRTDIGANLTKSMFTFLNEMDGIEDNWRNSNYDISNQQLNINAYAEVGLGLSRQINSRLTVGARVKALLGIGNMDLKLNNVAMNASLPSDARISQLQDPAYLSGLGVDDITKLRSEIESYHANLAVDAHLVIASFVTLLQMVMQAYVPGLYATLGLFIPLIVVNCIVLGRAEAFAAKNNAVASMFDGIGMGLGFTIALTLLGAVREFLGTGKIFDLTIMPEEYGMLVFVLAPGAFIALGYLIALINSFKKA